MRPQTSLFGARRFFLAWRTVPSPLENARKRRPPVAGAMTAPGGRVLAVTAGRPVGAGVAGSPIGFGGVSAVGTRARPAIRSSRVRAPPGPRPAEGTKNRSGLPSISISRVTAPRPSGSRARS